MQEGLRKVHRLALAAAIALFVVASGMRWQQARDTVTLVPGDLGFTRKAWHNTPERNLMAGDPSLFYPAMPIAARARVGDALRPAHFHYVVPHRPDGWLVIARSSKDHPSQPSSLDLLLNDGLLGAINNSATARIRIRASGHTDVLEARVGIGRLWLGSLTLVPHPAWLKPLNLAVPFSAWLVLLLLALGPSARARRIGFPIALAACTFFVYRYAFFTGRGSPISDLFFSDEIDFINPIRFNIFTFDMSKHMLFLPVLHGLYRVFRLLLASDVAALCGCFAFLGAANALAAHAWFRRWTGSDRTAALLAMLYAFAFSTWIYAAQFETYIVSALAANLFMVALFHRGTAGRWRWLAATSLYAAIAALLHPPLLVLIVLIVIAHVSRDGAPRAWLQAAAAAAACVAVVMTVSFALRTAYADETRGPPQPHLAGSSGESPLAEASQAARIVSMYASATNLTARGAANVACGQFVYALAGLPYPPRWTDARAGMRQLLHKGVGLFALAGIVVFWLSAGRGLFRSGAYRRRSVVLGLLVLAPTLIFFWYFNPGEMLLYSPPLLALVLAWAWRGQREGMESNTHDFALAAFALALAIHNAAMLGTYP